MNLEGKQGKAQPPPKVAALDTRKEKKKERKAKGSEEGRP